MQRGGGNSGIPEFGRPVTDRAVLAPAPCVIEGSYVKLRPLAGSDAPALFDALRRDDQEILQQFTADSPVASEQETLALIEAKLALTGNAYFACVPKATGKAGGFACMMRVDREHRVVEIGNVLYGPDLRRSRAGTEAVFLLARHAIEDLGFRRVEWKCNDLNAASRHAALRYGFTFEGVFRQHMIVKGRNRNTAWYSMLDIEWPKRREMFEAWLSPGNFDKNGKQIVALSQLNGLGGS